jgi:predicted ATP-binding protein involved in virulence
MVDSFALKSGSVLILRHLSLELFRGFEALELPLGRRLTLLMGENGAGKTSVLDAMAVALGSIQSYLPDVNGRSFRKRGDIHQQNGKRSPYTRVGLTSVDGVQWDRTLWRDRSSATTKQLAARVGLTALRKHLEASVLDPFNEGQPFVMPVFAYYGVGRALLDVPLSRKGFEVDEQPFAALSGALEADSRFRTAFAWFYAKENEELRLKNESKDFELRLPALECVRRAFQAMFPDLRDPHVTLNPLRFMVRQGQEPLDITQLSDGYQTLMGLVMDLSARMAMANPHLADPLAAEAIVMIDEVDLHLHPAWQQRVVGDLLRTFPNAQFVLSTHSPFVVESINNHLKRHAIRNLPLADSAIEALLPLDPADVGAYVMSEWQAQSLMDAELGLLDDRLLAHFNRISAVYEQMRDLEWASNPS